MKVSPVKYVFEQIDCVQASKVKIVIKKCQ